MNREIDARVAREVMEWPESICATVNEGASPWSPSTDMSAAMQVVGTVIRRLGGTVEMILEDDGWWVVFKVRPGCWHGWKEEIFPRAICLAALEAVKSTG